MKHTWPILAVLPVLVATALGSDSEEATSPSPFFARLNAAEVPAHEVLNGDDPYRSISGFTFGFDSPAGRNSPALHSQVNVTEHQTLATGGASAVVYEEGDAVFSVRALGGYAFGREALEDSWHTSFDFFGAGRLGPRADHFIKLGAFVDREKDFGKWGPAAGLLLGADSAHPVTLDVAYGQGFGEPVLYGQSIYSVADDDLQMQAAIMISPCLQVGVTGQYLRWEGVMPTEEDWKTGGFVSYHSPRGFSVSLGAAGGEHGATGFAHFTLRPRSHGATATGKGGKECIEPTDFCLARSWMTSPIRRQESLQLRETRVPVPSGPLGTLVCTFTVTGDPNVNLAAGFFGIHQVTYTNTSTRQQSVTINSIENFDGSVSAVGTNANLAPGQQLTAQGANVLMGAGPYDQSVVITVDGRQFNLTCSFPAGSPNPTSLAPLTIGP